MVPTEICLISPPSPFLISEKVFPDLGILYLSSVLKQQDNEVQVIDLAGVLVSTSQLSSNEITELRDKLKKKYKPELWK